MSLFQPRQGVSIGFHVYPSVSNEITLGDPETILWASIRQLCSRKVGEGIAEEIHGVHHKRDREAVARNLKLYIQQATEFYEAAHAAKPNTAPLIYYYSFLNLAKAYCELKSPKLHQRSESYSHGLSWKPNPKYLVNLEKDEILISTRGVWHLLWEAFVGLPCSVANPTRLRIKDLFSYCLGVGIEYERTFGGPQKLIDLEKPDTLYDDSTNEAWIRFSVHREELKIHRITAPKLLLEIQTSRSGYTEVRAADRDYRTFQSTIPVKIGPKDIILEAVRDDVAAFNAFVIMGREHRLEYSIPIQSLLPIRVPQIIVLYTILFWLGSVVRYDPHSLSDLMDSEYWILIDGFMSQSRLWLLELFEWALYQAETTLCSVR
jgi:hypothetical protein